MVKVSRKTQIKNSKYDMQTTLIGRRELEMLREAKELLRDDKNVIVGCWLYKQREGKTNE